jgi:hypothetical protein
LSQAAQLMDEEFLGIIGPLKLARLIFDHIEDGFEAGAQGGMLTQAFFQAFFLHGKPPTKNLDRGFYRTLPFRRNESHF